MTAEFEIHGKTMEHAKGAWAGSRPQWWTATHVASGFSITWHEDCEHETTQYRQRDAALTCLRMVVDELKPRDQDKREGGE